MRLRKAMQNREKHIDEVFRDGLKNHLMIPPAGVWSSIQTGLPVSHTTFPWKRVVAAVLVLVIAGTSWLVFHREHQQISQEQSTVVQKKVPKTGEQVIKENPVASQAPVLATVEEPTAEVVSTGKRNEITVQSETGVAPEKQGDVQIFQKEKEKISKIDNRPFRLSAAPETSLIAKKEGNMTSVPLVLALSLEPTVRVDGMQGFSDTRFNVPDNKKSKWGISGNLSPVYSFRYLNESKTGQQGFNYFYDQESPMVSYSGGVQVVYKRSRRFSFQTGLQYSRGGQVVNDIIFYRNLQTGSLLKRGIYSQNIPYPIETSIGFVSSASLDPFLTDFILPDGSYFTGDMAAQPEFENYEQMNTNINQEFAFLEIPFMMRYRVIDRKVGLNIISGLGTSFMVDNETYFMYQGNRVPLGHSESVSGMNLTGSIGFGFDYLLGSKIKLNIEPTFKYFLNSFNIDSNLGVHPYFFGFYSGVSYFF